MNDKRDFSELCKKAIILGNYDVLTNDDDDVLLCIKSVEGNDEIDNPTMLYDGKKHALLIKNNDVLIVCDEIHKDVRELLYTRNEVLIYEQESESRPAQEYMARLVKENGIEDIADKIIGINK